MTGDWVFGAIAALTLIHGLALLYVYRRGTAAGGTADAESYVLADGVECPGCGEHNEEGYRFCRQCVSELPAGMSFRGTSSGPETRRTL